MGCILRVPKLATFLGVCVRTIQYALRRLENAGLIFREVRIESGRRRSNRIHFLWLDSLFSSASCTGIAPVEEYPAEESEEVQHTDEPRPRFAQREDASGSTGVDLLEPLREAMQRTHREVGRQETTPTLANAATMHSTLCAAVGKALGIHEAVGMVVDLAKHGRALRPGKRWVWIRGMIAFAGNYFAAPERQTAAYRPEVELAPAATITTRTAFHDAAEEEFEVGR